MKMICSEYGTDAWQAAGFRKLTDSDIHIVCATPHGRQWQLLAERLSLDFLNTPRDPDAEAERLAFRIRHLPDIRSALAQYRRMQRAWRPYFCALPGMFAHRHHTWLVASPHALTGDGTVHVCPHRTNRAFHRMKQEFIQGRHSPSLYARVQIAMFITDRAYCDVINYWDSQKTWRYDGLSRHRFDFDRSFIEDTFLPAAIMLWREVRAKRDESTSVA